MNNPNTMQADIRQLDKPWLVLLVYLISLVLLLMGAINAPYGYGDPQLVAGFWITELVVALMLLLATWAFFPAGRIGLRMPQLVRPWQLMPLLLLLGSAVAVWAFVRLTLHPAILLDNVLSLKILRTTMLVGVSEEWMYRGLLLAALSRWFGLRRGALLSLFLFGALHLFNLVSGMPPLYAVMQFFMTMLIGATFVLAAVGTRSLVIPMLAHGIYDFCVIDTLSTIESGARSWPILIVSATGLVCGLLSLVWIIRLNGDEPFAESISG